MIASNNVLPGVASAPKISGREASNLYIFAWHRVTPAKGLAVVWLPGVELVNAMICRNLRKQKSSTLYAVACRMSSHTGLQRLSNKIFHSRKRHKTYFFNHTWFDQHSWNTVDSGLQLLIPILAVRVFEPTSEKSKCSVYSKSSNWQAVKERKYRNRNACCVSPVVVTILSFWLSCLTTTHHSTGQTLRTHWPVQTIQYTDSTHSTELN